MKTNHEWLKKNWLFRYPSIGIVPSAHVTNGAAAMIFREYELLYEAPTSATPEKGSSA
ncbi:MULTISPECIES: hypothetical protein [Methylosinus]|uniref:hypothetical protein n=1 Tax=Methylosinus TaxID=425 RepID=UPI001407A78C|nr:MULTISPECIES: hypothetical protein [Methylosinus]